MRAPSTRTTLLMLAASATVITLIINDAPVITDAEAPTTPTTPTTTAAPITTSGQQDEAYDTSNKKGPIALELVSDREAGEPISFDPGSEIDYNFSVKNVGTESAIVFVDLTVPVATGAILTDGSSDPAVLDYELNDGWTEIHPENIKNPDVHAFYYGKLKPGETTPEIFKSCSVPDYELSNPDGVLSTGSLTVEELESLMGQIHIIGKSLMTGPHGSPEQQYTMFGDVE